jgi:hypothetical protein
MRWDSIGFDVAGLNIRAKFQRNEVGVSGFFKGLVESPQERIEDEIACARIAAEYSTKTDGDQEENWHNAREFRKGLIDIQLRKKALGIVLDTAEV